MTRNTSEKKIIVTIIAYNASLTLQKLFESIPKDWVDSIIISDDCSHDNTFEIAKSFPDVIATQTPKKLHMGGNLKWVYKKALEYGADIVIVLHGDDQYDSSFIPKLMLLVLMMHFQSLKDSGQKNCLLRKIYN